MKEILSIVAQLGAIVFGIIGIIDMIRNKNSTMPWCIGYTLLGIALALS